MIFFKETSLTKIGIEEDDGFITHLYLGTDCVSSGAEQKETVLIKQAFDQLERYLNGQLKEFSLPLRPAGTDFMKSVWQKLGEVPFGKTASYKDIAIAIGNPEAVRAVGQANNKNPIPIFIPCHRIIGSNGMLVGYSGGLNIKKHLLELERRVILNPLNFCAGPNCVLSDFRGF